MQITLELSEQDLSHFRRVIERTDGALALGDPDAICAAARATIERLDEANLAPYIRRQFEHLRALIDMLNDEAWALPEAERGWVLRALAYFTDPEDLVPDDIPGLGYLDDAIMVQLAVSQLRPEIEAYADFCAYRQAEISRRGESADNLDRAHWLVDRRKLLHSRMRNRRRTRSVSNGGDRGLFSSH